MDQKNQHRVFVCTTCHHKGSDCRPGYELISRLSKAIEAAGDALPEDFSVSGTACMAVCTRPCTVAYLATRKATYLFGDVDSDRDIDDLVAFAKLYAQSDDVWDAELPWPMSMRRGLIARIPAAMIVTEAVEGAPS